MQGEQIRRLYSCQLYMIYDRYARYMSGRSAGILTVEVDHDVLCVFLAHPVPLSAMFKLHRIQLEAPTLRERLIVLRSRWIDEAAGITG